MSNIWDERKESLEVDMYQQKMIDRLLSIVANKNVLDIGCGYGNIELELADIAGSITAVDTSEMRTKKTARKCEKYKNVYVQQINGSLQEYKNEGFDVVFSFRTFQHMEKEQFKNYCKEVHRVLKKEGLFVFQVVEEYQGYQPIRGKIIHLAHTEKEVGKALKMFDEVKYEREIIPRKGKNYPWLWVKTKKCKMDL